MRFKVRAEEAQDAMNGFFRVGEKHDGDDGGTSASQHKWLPLSPPQATIVAQHAHVWLDKGARQRPGDPHQGHERFAQAQREQVWRPVRQLNRPGNLQAADADGEEDKIPYALRGLVFFLFARSLTSKLAPARREERGVFVRIVLGLVNRAPWGVARQGRRLLAAGFGVRIDMLEAKPPATGTADGSVGHFNRLRGRRRRWRAGPKWHESLNIFPRRRTRQSGSRRDNKLLIFDRGCPGGSWGPGAGTWMAQIGIGDWNQENARK